MPPPSQFANEIARLMRDPDAMRSEWERMQRSGHRGHYDPNQPRVPAGHSGGGRWTDTGRSAGTSIHNREHPLVQPAFFSPARRAATKALEALLAIFAALSVRNTPEHRAVFEFNARQFLKDPSGELSRADVARLSRDQVRNVCGRLEDVQRDTDKVERAVQRDGGWLMSPQQFGTAVHKKLEDLINGRNETYLHAEVSRIKGELDDADYGTKGSVRIDVLEYAGEGTVCVYDIKTGTSRRSGLTPARMRELAENALKAYPNTQRIIVTEVRPSR